MKTLSAVWFGAALLFALPAAAQEPSLPPGTEPASPAPPAKRAS